MKEYRPSKRGAYVLLIWLAAAALIMSLICGIIAAFSITAGVAAFIVIALIALAEAIVIIPAYIKNKLTEVSEKRIIISGGIIFRHKRIISCSKIIYVSRIKTPVSAIFGLCSIRLSTAGSVFLIPLLAQKESEELMSLI